MVSTTLSKLLINQLVLNYTILWFTLLVSINQAVLVSMCFFKPTSNWAVRWRGWQIWRCSWRPPEAFLHGSWAALIALIGYLTMITYQLRRNDLNYGVILSKSIPIKIGDTISTKEKISGLSSPIMDWLMVYEANGHIIPNHGLTIISTTYCGWLRNPAPPKGCLKAYR